MRRKLKMYRHEERLTIGSEIFDDMRDQFNVLLSALLQEANISGKDGELTVKLKVGTATEREYKKGAFVKEWTEPRFTWNMSRKVKESKFDVKSSSGEGYVLIFDEAGKPTIKEAPNKQISMFDTPNFMKPIKEESAPEEIEDLEDTLEPEESSFQGEVTEECEDAMDELLEEMNAEEYDKEDK
jgi:hypothetical protein